MTQAETITSSILNTLQDPLSRFKLNTLPDIDLVDDNLVISVPSIPLEHEADLSSICDNNPDHLVNIPSVYKKPEFDSNETSLADIHYVKNALVSLGLVNEEEVNKLKVDFNYNGITLSNRLSIPLNQLNLAKIISEGLPQSIGIIDKLTRDTLLSLIDKPRLVAESFTSDEFIGKFGDTVKTRFSKDLLERFKSNKVLLFSESDLFDACNQNYLERDLFRELLTPDDKAKIYEKKPKNLFTRKILDPLKKLLGLKKTDQEQKKDYGVAVFEELKLKYAEKLKGAIALKRLPNTFSKILNLDLNDYRVIINGKSYIAFGNTERNIECFPVGSSGGCHTSRNNEKTPSHLPVIEHLNRLGINNDFFSTYRFFPEESAQRGSANYRYMPSLEETQQITSSFIEEVKGRINKSMSPFHFDPSRGSYITENLVMTLSSEELAENLSLEDLKKIYKKQRISEITFKQLVSNPVEGIDSIAALIIKRAKTRGMHRNIELRAIDADYPELIQGLNISKDDVVLAVSWFNNNKLNIKEKPEEIETREKMLAIIRELDKVGATHKFTPFKDSLSTMFKDYAEQIEKILSP